MNCSDRDMERVNVGSIRNGPVGDKRTGQVYRLWRGSKDRQATEGSETSPGRQRITGARFLQNYRRNVQLELVATRSPPLPSQTLMCSPDDITSWTGRQIAHNRGFNVHCRWHCSMLTEWYLIV
jgi:hypothetical protein